MSERINRIERLVEMLKAGLITRAEYDELKQGVLGDGSSSGQEHSDAASTSDIPSTIAREVRRLRDRTYTSLGVTRAELEAVDRAGFAILKGTDVFVTGVEAHTRMVVAPGTDLRNLLELKPGFVPMAVYMGVTQTIDSMLEKAEPSQFPPEVRGFMATYGMLAWDWLVESGIDFDPGKGNSPAELFQRLDLSPNTLSSVEMQALNKRESVATTTPSSPSRTGSVSGLEDIPAHAVMYHDDEPVERLEESCNNTPMHVFFTQEREPSLHEWRVELVQPDGDRNRLASGTTHTATEAQEQLDTHMVELTRNLIKLRDRIVERENTRGRNLRQAPGEANFGGWWSGSVQGLALVAVFQEWMVPLARFPVREVFEDCLILLYHLTRDHIGIEDVNRVAEQRKNRVKEKQRISRLLRHLR